jgi:hypothetical protein
MKEKAGPLYESAFLQEPVCILPAKQIRMIFQEYEISSGGFGGLNEPDFN